MNCPKVWRDTSEEKMDEAFVVPSGKGERSILCQIGSGDSRLLSGCMLLFRGMKSNKSNDYRTEMNWNVFSDCCEKKVFPAMQVAGKKSVLVLDRAT